MKNLYALMRSFILLGFSAFIIANVVSGRINHFVHPRFVPLSVFTSIVLLVLGLMEWRTVLHRHGATRALKITTIAVFLVPLLCGVIFPPLTLGSDIVRKKGGPSLVTEPKESKGKALMAAGANNLADDSMVEVTQKNYLDKLAEIAEHAETYDGRKIRFAGFIYKEDGFKDNEFSAIRFAITCCVADAMPVGFFCKYSEAKILEPDAWYEITGRIEFQKSPLGESYDQTEDDRIPVIKVSDFSRIPAPADPYVYPK